MVDQNCAYCMEGELVAQFGIKICELPSSKVYLFKEQSHPGRCIVSPSPQKKVRKYRDNDWSAYHFFWLSLCIPETDRNKGQKSYEA